MMEISRIEIYRVAMPLVYPFRTAFGNDETIESVLVRLCAGDAYGWGEAASWRHPAYCPECAATQFTISKQFLAPLLLGQDIESGQQLQQRLSAIKGNQFAKAGLRPGLVGPVCPQPRSALVEGSRRNKSDGRRRRRFRRHGDHRPASGRHSYGQRARLQAGQAEVSSRLGPAHDRGGPQNVSPIRPSTSTATAPIRLTISKCSSSWIGTTWR